MKDQQFEIVPITPTGKECKTIVLPGDYLVELDLYQYYDSASSDPTSHRACISVADTSSNKERYRKEVQLAVWPDKEKRYFCHGLNTANVCGDYWEAIGFFLLLENNVCPSGATGGHPRFDYKIARQSGSVRFRYVPANIPQLHVSLYGRDTVSFIFEEARQEGMEYPDGVIALDKHLFQHLADMPAHITRSPRQA